jgi:EVE domain
MTSHWIAVASAGHVRIGHAAGFMQVCHGKGAPLKRIKPGDHVVYYSPVETFKENDRLQAFTAIGTVRTDEPYQADMDGGFHPFRHDVTWIEAQGAPIRPLLDRLEFTRGRSNWGYAFRFGLLPVSAYDFELIAQAMGAKLPQLLETAA